MLLTSVVGSLEGGGLTVSAASRIGVPITISNMGILYKGYIVPGFDSAVKLPHTMKSPKKRYLKVEAIAMNDRLQRKMSTRNATISMDNVRRVNVHLRNGLPNWIGIIKHIATFDT